MRKWMLAVMVVAAVEAGDCSGGRLAFEEAAERLALREPLVGIMSHAAACGDVDGDGDLDLYVGAFCDRPADQYLGRKGPVPNLLLINNGGIFSKVHSDALSFMARTSGAAFVDFDNDSDLDLYVSNNSKSKGLRVANRLFENVDGEFRNVSQGNAACIVMGGRSIGVLDYDCDGLLDMLVAEDSWTGSRTRLFRNTGKLGFADVSERAALPPELPGLGVATVDFNGDGFGDIFVGQANRLFLCRPDGIYVEGDSQVFQYEPVNNEATPCGVACGDLNLDALMDIVIVDHSQPARQHLYLNLGTIDGQPRFRDVTAEAGLAYEFPSWTPEKLHLKHAHVEICDFDNDGLPDILPSATYRTNGIRQPFICRNLGCSKTIEGVRVPRFEVPPVEDADSYFAAGPAADFDRDGKVDIFMASWFGEIPSMLFLNRSEAGNWLQVKVVARTINRMGVGSKVKLYRTGQLGKPQGLIGYNEIAVGFGFCTGHEAVAHFGLGEAGTCDVQVILPGGNGIIERKAVDANQLLVVRQ